MIEIKFFFFYNILKDLNAKNVTEEKKNVFYHRIGDQKRKKKTREYVTNKRENSDIARLSSSYLFFIIISFFFLLFLLKKETENVSFCCLHEISKRISFPYFFSFLFNSCNENVRVRFFSFLLIHSC